MSAAAQSDQNLHAILWMILSTALFTLVFASGKLTGGEISAFQILFFRYIGGFATLLLIVKLRKESLNQHRSDRPLSHFMRAVCGSSGGAAAIHAAAHMPIVDATALGLLQSVFIILLGVLILKERIAGLQGGAILLSCLGAAIVMSGRGAFSSFDTAYLLPAAFALLGAVLIAVESVLIKTLSAKDSALTVLLHVNFFGMVFLALPAFMTWDGANFWPLAFVFLGPLALFAQYCTIRSYRLGDISLVAPIDYTWLIFAGLIGLIVFQEVPTLQTLIGCLIILVAGVALTLVRTPLPAKPKNSD